MSLNLKYLLSTFIANSRRFKSLVILFPYIILIVIGAYFAYQKCVPTFVKDGVKYTRKNICGDSEIVEIPSKIKDQNEKKVDAKIYKDEKVNYWEIIDTSKRPPFPIGLKVYDKDLLNSPIRWNNFLLSFNRNYYIEESNNGFFDSFEHYTLHSQIRSIRVYNIETGETFDISLDKPIWGEIWYIKSQVLDNAYYFGVGGAHGASLGYKLDLPPRRSSRITKLKAPIGGKITKYGNTYISKSCYEGCSYALFNPKLLTTSPLQRITDASNAYDITRKEESIGIDSHGRMILNIKDIPKDSNNQQYFDTESISAVPLANEQSTINLLKPSDFPEKIHNYFMIDNIDKILMLGSSKVYIYDINANKFKEIQIGTANKDSLSSKNISATKTDKAICITTGNGSVKFAIDLTTETYLDTLPGNCNKQTVEKNHEDIFKSLNLPDNFKLVYNQRVYKTYNIVRGIPKSELPENSEIINKLEN